MIHGLKRYTYIFLVIFSIYIISCLPLVYAIDVREYIGNSRTVTKKISFAPFDTSIRIDPDTDFSGLKCGDTSKKMFHLIIERAASDSFDLEISATAMTANLGVDSDITSLISCNPTKNLINNQQITCFFDQKAFLDRFSACPPEKPSVLLTLFAIVKTQSGDIPLSLTKQLSIIDPSLKASIEVQGGAYSTPDVNCLLGSEIQTLAKVTHAEAITDGIKWGFVVNKTKEYWSNIDCSILTEGNINTGSKDDLYSCTFTVPSLAFDECISGARFPIDIVARIENYEASDEFNATTIKEDLDIELSVGSIGSIDCQIVSIENGIGDCVPKSPQKEVRVTLTGNRISELETFAYKYRIDSGNFTSMSCTKLSANEYEQILSCNMFIPRKNINEDPPESETYSDYSNINVTLQTRYVNTFSSVSGTTTVNYGGQYRDESTGTLTKLEEAKEEIKNYQKIIEKLRKAKEWIDFAIGCCETYDALETIEGDGIKKYLKDSVKEKFGVDNADWSKGIFFDMLSDLEWILAAIEKDGIPIAECILEALSSGYEKNIQTLNDFENVPETNPEQLDEDYSLGVLETTGKVTICVAKKVANNLVPGCFGVLFPPKWNKLIGCTACIALIYLAGQAGAPDYCGQIMAKKTQIKSILDCAKPNAYGGGPGAAFAGLMICASKAIAWASILMTYFIYIKNKEILELSAKITNMRMEMETSNAESMVEYSAAYSGYVSDLSKDLMTTAGLQNLFAPKPEAYISFNDSSGNLIPSGATVCGSETITIGYNFEKFTRIKGFESELEIKGSNRHPETVRVISLNSDIYSGTLTQNIDTMLDIASAPSDERDGVYQFIFRHGSPVTEKYYSINYKEVC